MFEVYITKSGKFLPNEPVSNDEMEFFLGLINDSASKARRIILRNNGINSRYYALDKNGNPTHTNAELANNAINTLFDTEFTSSNVELLSCGTSTPDHLLPSHAAMVHGFWEPGIRLLLHALFYVAGYLFQGTQHQVLQPNGKYMADKMKAAGEYVKSQAIEGYEIEVSEIFSK